MQKQFQGLHPVGTPFVGEGKSAQPVQFLIGICFESVQKVGEILSALDTIKTFLESVQAIICDRIRMPHREGRCSLTLQKVFDLPIDTSKTLARAVPEIPVDRRRQNKPPRFDNHVLYQKRSAVQR